MNPRPNPPPLYPIPSDDVARAMLHGAGATLGSDLLGVLVPATTPLLDLIRAGERLGYRTTGEGGREGLGYRLVMRRTR